MSPTTTPRLFGATLPTSSTCSSSSTISVGSSSGGTGAVMDAAQTGNRPEKQSSSLLSTAIYMSDPDPNVDRGLDCERRGITNTSWPEARDRDRDLPTHTIGPGSNTSSQTRNPEQRSSHTLKPKSKPKRPIAERQYTYPGHGDPCNPYVVDFGPSDPSNPYNWSTRYRWFLTMLIGVSALCPPFTSVSYSSTVLEITQVFGMSREMATAGISLFILGNAIGVLVWSPISELRGRTFAYSVSYPLFTAFNLGLALAKDTRTLMVMRFLSGLFGSSTLTIAGGQIGDMWAAHERAMATSVFSLAPFLGPVLGPIIGGFVTERRGFRWVYWIQFVYAAVITIVSIIVQPETYAPTILRRKAKALTKASRAKGKNEVYIAKYDKIKRSTRDVVKEGLLRPFELLFTEVIVGCLAIYGAIVYGILYLFFACFPLIYQETRGWSVGQGGLAFLGMGLGLIMGNAINPLGNVWYRRATIAGQPTPPEARLPLALVAAVLCPIGLIWFAWTSAPPVHWIWSILACIPFGLSFILIFSALVNYIIDSYTLYAASALAAQAVLRCLFGAAFPLFAVRMYRTLGLHWAGTLVAFLSLLCTPMPFFFYRYGPYLRRRSRYAPSAPAPAPIAGIGSYDDPSQVSDEEARSDEIRKVKTTEIEALEPEWAADAGERAKEGGEGVEVDVDLPDLGKTNLDRDVEKGRS